jgi:hypothetical protein
MWRRVRRWPKVGRCTRLSEADWLGSASLDYVISSRGSSKLRPDSSWNAAQNVTEWRRLPAETCYQSANSRGSGQAPSSEAIVRACVTSPEGHHRSDAWSTVRMIKKKRVAAIIRSLCHISVCDFHVPVAIVTCLQPGDSEVAISPRRPNDASV